jgi:hypothetical protein
MSKNINLPEITGNVNILHLPVKAKIYTFLLWVVYKRYT